MSSARPQPRRGTPLAPSPHPKPALSVDQWEAKTPLTDLQVRSIGGLKDACARRPIPLKFQREVDTSRPGTPSKLVPSRSGTPKLGAVSSQPGVNPLHPLHPTQPISTPQQFHDWFALIERSMSHAQDTHFRAHLSSVGTHLARCDTLLERVTEVEDDVVAMRQDWEEVEEGGRSLQGACERLLEERDRLIEFTDAIAARLDYFTDLEHAIRMLNHPGETLVLQPDFLPMVDRIDACIEYLQTHRHFREAEIYLLRFQQCMTRAMTLIKIYFVSTLRNISSDAQRRLAEKDISQTAQTHLLYSKFRSVSSSLAPLLAELEHRALSHPEELSALLGECHASYLAARKSLVVGTLVEEIRLLEPIRSDLVELTRAGCGYLRQLCSDEFSLYKRFFNSGEDKLYRYLEGLCDYLYDDLRPRILHEPQLTVLCEVCTVLQALMVLDVSALSPSNSGSDSDSEYASTAIEIARSSKPLERLHVAQLLQMVLQDAQTRLFFRAQAVVQSEIQYYAPKTDDLDYPAKLTEKRVSDNASDHDGDDDADEYETAQFLPPLKNKELWYPPLQKTHWILSQLHDFVQPAIFEDMAHEAISLCCQSLVTASELLSTRASASDAHLFLVRHLLVLKEIAAGLSIDEVQQKDKAAVHGSVIDTLGSLLRSTTSYFNPSSIIGGLASLGMPRAAANIADARMKIDHELKRVCEELIAQCADAATAPLRKVQSPPSSAPPNASTPQSQGQITGVAEAYNEFVSICVKEVEAWIARLRLYLEDEKTVSVLLPPMQSTIVDEYATFQDFVRQLEDQEGLPVMMSGPDLWSMLRRAG